MAAVVGGCGAGKSVLAQALCEEFGSLAARVSLDHFYCQLSHLQVSPRKRVNLDNLRRIDWEAVEEALACMSRGNTFELPECDFATQCRLPRTNPWVPRPLAFWQGL